jgi:hypothetical protein
VNGEAPPALPLPLHRRKRTHGGARKPRAIRALILYASIKVTAPLVGEIEFVEPTMATRSLFKLMDVYFETISRCLLNASHAARCVACQGGSDLFHLA